MVTVTNRKRTYEFDLGYGYMRVYRCAIAESFGVGTEYKCTKCDANFLDRNDNYAFCPYCGRKIVDKKELVK